MPENWFVCVCVLGTRICLIGITIVLYYVRDFRYVLLFLIIFFIFFILFYGFIEDDIFIAVAINVTVLWDLTTLETF